jgi:Putative auto-transporter adhesin, head GIN domain
MYRCTKALPFLYCRYLLLRNHSTVHSVSLTVHAVVPFGNTYYRASLHGINFIIFKPFIMNVKHLLTAVLLLVTTAATAQTIEKKKSTINKVSVQPFHKLVINASIDVLLIEDNEPGILYIEGDKTYFNDITVKQEAGVLTISAAKNKSFKNKIYIGLPVKNLTAIDIYEKSFVTGMNTLQSKDLVINMYNDCMVNLKSTGAIEIRSSEDVSYTFHKKLPREYRNRTRK